MSLRICFVADGRSPIARSWIQNVARAGHEAHLVSTYPCDASDLPVRSFAVVPVAGSTLATPAGSGAANGKPPSLLFQLRGGKVFSVLGAARRWLGPLDVFKQAPRLRRIVDAIRPDVVHALRIPYEGLLAATALQGTPTPLLVSVWGNDFTLHAARSATLAWLTRRALGRADGLHPDCERDRALALKNGFSAEAPCVVMPGNGGLDTSVFVPGEPPASTRAALGLSNDGPIILNPRGLRAYVRNDTFFAAIPRVLERAPRAQFVALAMAGNDFAEGWARKLGAGTSLRLLPPLPRSQVAELFRAATVSVSPSEHDGTPNTLLEAMACGSFPIAGDIPSIREWITDARNGLLVDPADPVALADAIIRALEDPGLRASAAAANRTLIAERADRDAVLQTADRLYAHLVSRRARA